MSARGKVLVALLFLSGACVGTESLDVAESTSAVCASASTLRVVSANMAHLEADQVRPNFWGTGYTSLAEYYGEMGVADPKPFWLWAQTEALDDLELPGQANVFVLQEVDENADRTLHVDWPFEFDESFGHYDGNDCTGYVHDSAPWAWGPSGNATITNVSRAESSTKWPLGAHCTESDKREALVTHLREGTTDVYVINVHLSFCFNGAFTLNSCELTRLMYNIEHEIPDDAVVVVAGDFNVHARGNASSSCTRGEGPAHFERLLGVMHEAGFTQVPVREDNGSFANIVDHIFLRDPAYRTRGVRGSFAQSTVWVWGNMLRLSDHRWVQADIQLDGPGMSPAFVPFMAAL